MKCGQTDCDDDATCAFLAPGHDDYLPSCEPHYAQAVGVYGALGLSAPNLARVAIKDMPKPPLTLERAASEVREALDAGLVIVLSFEGSAMDSDRVGAAFDFLLVHHGIRRTS